MGKAAFCHYPSYRLTGLLAPNPPATHTSYSPRLPQKPHLHQDCATLAKEDTLPLSAFCALPLHFEDNCHWFCTYYFQALKLLSHFLYGDLHSNPRGRCYFHAHFTDEITEVCTGDGDADAVMAQKWGSSGKETQTQFFLQPLCCTAAECLLPDFLDKSVESFVF